MQQHQQQGIEQLGATLGTLALEMSRLREQSAEQMRIASQNSRAMRRPKRSTLSHLRRPATSHAACAYSRVRTTYNVLAHIQL